MIKQKSPSQKGTSNYPCYHPDSRILSKFEYIKLSVYSYHTGTHSCVTCIWRHLLPSLAVYPIWNTLQKTSKIRLAWEIQVTSEPKETSSPTISSLWGKMILYLKTGKTNVFRSSLHGLNLSLYRYLYNRICFSHYIIRTYDVKEFHLRKFKLCFHHKSFLIFCSNSIIHTPIRIWPIPAIPDIEASIPLLNSVPHTCVKPLIRNAVPEMLRPSWYTIIILPTFLSENRNDFSASMSIRKKNIPSIK